MKTYDAVKFGTDTKVSLSRNDWVFGPQELTEADFDFAINALTDVKEKEFSKTKRQQSVIDWAYEGNRCFDILTNVNGKWYEVNPDSGNPVDIETEVKLIVSSLIWDKDATDFKEIMTYEDNYGDLVAAVVYPPKV